MTTGRAEASELAFYLPHHPRAYVYNDSGVVSSQYDVWAGPETDDHGRDALILSPNDRLSPNLTAAFRKVHRLEDVTVDVGAGRTHHYYAWHAEDLCDWPPLRVSHRGKAWQ